MNCGHTRYEKPPLRRSTSQMNIGMFKLKFVKYLNWKGFQLRMSLTN